MRNEQYNVATSSIMVEGVCKRIDRETETQRDTQRDTQTQRHRDSETETQRQRDTKIDRDTETQRTQKLS